MLVYSDNAKTFKASANLMKQQKVNSEFLGFLQNKRIEWKFNLERTPWLEGGILRAYCKYNKTMSKEDHR